MGVIVRSTLVLFLPSLSLSHFFSLIVVLVLFSETMPQRLCQLRRLEISSFDCSCYIFFCFFFCHAPFSCLSVTLKSRLYVFSFIVLTILSASFLCRREWERISHNYCSWFWSFALFLSFTIFLSLKISGSEKNFRFRQACKKLTFILLPKLL